MPSAPEPRAGAGLRLISAASAGESDMMSLIACWNRSHSLIPRLYIKSSCGGQERPSPGPRAGLANDETQWYRLTCLAVGRSGGSCIPARTSIAAKTKSTNDPC